MKLLKQITNALKSFFTTYGPMSLDEYITLKRPQNNADLDRIVREFNELRYW